MDELVGYGWFLSSLSPLKDIECLVAAVPQDRRHPKTDAVQPHGQRKMDQCHAPDPKLCQNRGQMRRLLGRFSLRDNILKEVFFVARQS